MAEYKKMEETKNMNNEPKRGVVGSKEAEKETDVGSFQAGFTSPEDFVKSVLAREGGDPARAEQAAHSIQEFWVNGLKRYVEWKEGGEIGPPVGISPEKFSEGVYESAVKMLKKREGQTEKEKAREAAHRATLERVTGKRAA
ncbi:MAG: hypothetical protein EHM45_25050 [Desulfobacteraceae bacterium]|nr:MAG: hypothetical protein EHM45_25050 [Desulfobacteraceae bacterium]